MAGTLFFNRFSVSPKLPLGSVRIVLDWGENPKDLDAHFVKEGGYHISYRNMKVSADGIAKLDRDDIDSYGPETITAKKINRSAKYYFYVHDFTNKSDYLNRGLSKSKASVKVYVGDNELLHIFKVPNDLAGNEWRVFEIKNGQIIYHGE